MTTYFYVATYLHFYLTVLLNFPLFKKCMWILLSLTHILSPTVKSFIKNHYIIQYYNYYTYSCNWFNIFHWHGVISSKLHAHSILYNSIYLLLITIPH